ncbi:hypothetical protein [Palleronia rufa]
MKGGATALSDLCQPSAKEARSMYFIVLIILVALLALSVFNFMSSK